MKQRSMTSGNIVQLLILFTLPLLIGNIFQQFYSMADTFIVGRTIGVDALAAVGCTGSITFLIIGFAQGFTSGLSIRVAQRYGAGDEEGVRRGIACGALLSLAATVILTVVSCAFTRTILVAMNTPAEILEQAYDYLIVIFAGTGTTMLFNYVSNISRALGDSRTPLVFLVVACIINIFLDYFLILNVGMNVEGAAYATIAAQLLSGVACLVYMLRRFPQMHLHGSDWKLTWDSVSHALALSLPMGFQMSVIALGQIAVQFALNGLGSVYVAAFTASQKIDNMAIQPALSFGVGISTFAAQNYGAGKIHRIKEGILKCGLLSGGFSIVIGAVIVLFGKNLVALFVGAGGDSGYRPCQHLPDDQRFALCDPGSDGHAAQRSAGTGSGRYHHLRRRDGTDHAYRGGTGLYRQLRIRGCVCCQPAGLGRRSDSAGDLCRAVSAPAVPGGTGCGCPVILPTM